MKRTSVLPIAVLAACVAAPAAGAATFKGAVVGRDAQRSAIAVASASGAVHTVRVQRLRALGARLTISAARRPDGTFGAARVSAAGHSGSARIHGVVVRRSGARAFVSAGGTVLAVRGMPRAARAGRVVTVAVAIRGDGLHGMKIVQAGASGLIQVEGTIATLSPFTIALENGAAIQLTVPAALTLPTGLAVGDEVEAVVAFANGTYTLVTIDADRADGQRGEHRGEVDVHGSVTMLTAESVTVQPAKGDAVKFAVPAGFDLSGIQVGSKVEAKGVSASGTLTLTGIETDDQNDDNGDGGGDDGHDHGHHHGGGGDHGG